MLTSTLTKVLAAASGLALIIAGIMAVSSTIERKNATIATQKADISMYKDREVLAVDALIRATGNNKLIPKDIPVQIQLLGESLVGANKTLSNQSEAIDNLAQEREVALQEADRQAALRKGVIERSKQLETQLQQISLEPVERERLEEELRRVQDLAFKGGL